MCAGLGNILLRANVKDEIFAAVAGPNQDGPGRTLSMYTSWVHTLATTGFADEFVVLASALGLTLKSDVSPEHVTTDGRKWAISMFAPTNVVYPVVVGRCVKQRC